MIATAPPGPRVAKVLHVDAGDSAHVDEAARLAALKPDELVREALTDIARAKTLSPAAAASLHAHADALLRVALVREASEARRELVEEVRRLQTSVARISREGAP